MTTAYRSRTHSLLAVAEAAAFDSGRNRAEVVLKLGVPLVVHYRGWSDTLPAYWYTRYGIEISLDDALALIEEETT